MGIPRGKRLVKAGIANLLPPPRPVQGIAPPAPPKAVGGGGAKNSEPLAKAMGKGG